MRRVAIALLCVLLSGCYTIRFKRGKLQANGDEPPREHWHHTYFNGVWDPNGPIQVDDYCPGGAYLIESRMGLLDVLGQEGARGVVEAGTYGVFRWANAAPPATDVVSPAGAYFGRQFTVWTPTSHRLFCAVQSIRRLKVAVIKLSAKGGLSQGVVDLFTEALVGDLRKRPGVAVMSEADMTAILGLERQKQMLGCADESCLAELGGALGVDRLITGSLGRIGGTLVVNIASLDPKKVRAVASVSERIKTDKDDAILEMLPGFVSQLLLEPAAPPPPPAK